jgi:hypothetical protein
VSVARDRVLIAREQVVRAIELVEKAVQGAADVVGVQHDAVITSCTALTELRRAGAKLDLLLKRIPDGSAER